ncbi:MAG: hypothetical protein H0W50_03875 [Parachlamydiaceae bacterium]|nr:hypothetical protein [Parachlamydiaceae bacterium]
MHTFFFTSALILTPLLHLSADSPYTGIIEVKVKPAQDNLSPTENTNSRFEPFTGKIIRNKVRMRLQPSLEASILCELTRDDLLNVVDESNEFYVILPPPDTRAYIFRTFVLDNTVEGNRVNVRLEPALEAPVIAQLNTGDRVEGTISPLSSKWLEITPPSSTRFYVCKEYVENVGAPSMMAQIEKRRTEVAALLNSAQMISENELQKKFQNINLDSAIAHLNSVIKQYTDFPQYGERARELLNNIQEVYLQKKISYLENRAITAETSQQHQSAQIAALNTTHTEMIHREKPKAINKDANNGVSFEIINISESSKLTSQDLMESKKAENYSEFSNWNDPFSSKSMTAKMSTWIPNERSMYESWAIANAVGDATPSPQDFYEVGSAITLHGILEPYSRTVKNKPGDYLLVSPTTALPIAYLYSTRVNLQDRVGHEVTLHGLKRPNNNFAFSAYYVISVD